MDGFLLQKVDLHAHSTASDGSLTPKEVVELAKSNEIGIFSLTDHDTVSGLKEAEETAKQLGIKLIPGIEVTADTSIFGKGKREFHILGYYINPYSPAIKQLTEFSQNSRIKRNKELLSKLEKLGYGINYEYMVKKYGENFGKPNVAKELIKKGFFKEREEAIDFLSSLKVKREKLDYRTIIKLIKEAGGIPIIAHPITLKITMNDLYCFLKKAKEEGVEGLEVYHYRHKPSESLKLKEICKELKLYYTAGSDFHGDNKPCIKLGFLNVKLKDINFPIL